MIHSGKVLGFREKLFYRLCVLLSKNVADMPVNDIIDLKMGGEIPSLSTQYFHSIQVRRFWVYRYLFRGLVIVDIGGLLLIGCTR